MRASPKLIATARWSLVVTASAATLLAVFVAIENWRGDRAWGECERVLKARGEHLDLAEFQPPPVPDHLNFFKTPLLERLAIGGSKNEAARKALQAELRLGNLAAGQYTSPKDFPAIRDHIKEAGLLSGPDAGSPAADILKAMHRLDPLFAEVRDAAINRPAAGIDYGDSPFNERMDLGWLFSFAQALGLHAAAELTTDDVATAFADTFALLRLANGVAVQRPTLMSMLVSIAMQDLATKTIREGCERHLWNEAQLAEFQRLLLESRPPELWGKVLRAERAFGLHFVNVEPKAKMLEGTWPRWIFRGWVQQNKVALCRAYDDGLLTVFASSPDRIFPAHLAGLQKTTDRIEATRSPYQYLNRLVLPHLAEIARNVGLEAGRILQTATLCALERHRLSHGNYPSHLGDLVPKYYAALPLDIFDGQPLRYVETPKGGYQLYLVGLNGSDEAGKNDDLVLTLPTSK